MAGRTNTPLYRKKRRRRSADQDHSDKHEADVGKSQAGPPRLATTSEMHSHRSRTRDVARAPSVGKLAIVQLLVCLFSLLSTLPTLSAQLTSSEIPSATPSLGGGGPGQDGGGRGSGRGSGSVDAGSSATSTSSAAAATVSPIALVESTVTTAQLNVNSTVPARFYLNAPFANTNGYIYITATLCDGPPIPPYDIDDEAVLDRLQLSWYEAYIATLPRLYLSINTNNQNPGPNSQDGGPAVEYFVGGQATINDTSTGADGAWISIWPPKDTRNVTTGAWNFLIAASSEGAPLQLHETQGLHFEDSDNSHALLVTYNASQGTSSNLTLALLPTFGYAALHDSNFYNSSVCAIAQSFQKFNNTQDPSRPAPVFNRSLTTRGQNYPGANGTRVQWEVSNLQPGTNYTAWLIDSAPLGTQGASSTIMWPAVKFVTKQTGACRLVYDVDFCPSVAYSIPVNAELPTDRALQMYNETVMPNYVNFSSTIDTFACGSEQFGDYSSVQTCDSCKSAYRDWLCAVTMPRCVDPLPRVNGNTSAAVPDILDLVGSSTGLNADTLPYILDRNNNSRQSYIDSETGLDAGRYGELLPCIYTCYFVARSCPQPLVQWYCPLWDISAQGSYGTFADAGIEGIGGGHNGGNGYMGQRWGGVTQYVASDNFGNLYCNSMGVERILIATNPASRRVLPAALLVVTSALAGFFLLL